MPPLKCFSNYSHRLSIIIIVHLAAATQQCQCGLLDKWYILCFSAPRIPAHTCKHNTNLLTTARSSTGVLMWEVYSEGRLPYDNRTNAEVVESLNAGLRLLKPRLAPDAIYLLMEWCWKEVSSWCPQVQQHNSAGYILFFFIADRNLKTAPASPFCCTSWPPSPDCNQSGCVFWLQIETYLFYLLSCCHLKQLPKTCEGVLIWTDNKWLDFALYLISLYSSC